MSTRSWSGARGPGASTGLVAAIVAVVSLVAPARAQQGCCFLWNNDGSNTCVPGVTAAQCDALGGWGNHRFIEGGDCDNGLPIKQEPDIRWRYVMVVTDCRIVGDECQELHKLFRCGSDATHF